MTDLGREIPITDGRKPEWLADDEIVEISSGESRWTGRLRSQEWEWQFVRSIRLRADHHAYTVLDHNQKHLTSLKIWCGEQEPPNDWDGKGTLMRRGTTTDNLGVWRHRGRSNDIIGYTPRRKVVPPRVMNREEVMCLINDVRTKTEPAPSFDTDKYVLVERMTEAEMVEYARRRNYVFLRAFKDLGIIKPDPTPLERYMEQYPEDDRDTVLRVLEWKGL